MEHKNMALVVIGNKNEIISHKYEFTECEQEKRNDTSSLRTSEKQKLQSKEINVFMQRKTHINTFSSLSLFVWVDCAKRNEKEALITSLTVRREVFSSHSLRFVCLLLAARKSGKMHFLLQLTCVGWCTPRVPLQFFVILHFGQGSKKTRKKSKDVPYTWAGRRYAKRAKKNSK